MTKSLKVPIVLKAYFVAVKIIEKEMSGAFKLSSPIIAAGLIHMQIFTSLFDEKIQIGTPIAKTKPNIITAFLLPYLGSAHHPPNQVNKEGYEYDLRLQYQVFLMTLT